MGNLDLYERVRKVPDEAKKKIGGGRLSGMTDINPMWRIKKLTEEYGPCGIGWYTEVLKQWTETGANNEVVAYVNISLFVKDNGEWSKPIFGTGGSMFVAKEKSGLFTSDECYKMAYTDAISVACKSLGFGADVYFEKDATKYIKQEQTPVPIPERKISKLQIELLQGLCLQAGWTDNKLIINVNKNFGSSIKVLEDMTEAQYNSISAYLQNKVNNESQNK